MGSFLRVKFNKLFLELALLACFGLIAVTSQSADRTPPSASDVVDTFQLLLIDAMKRGEKLGYDGRYNLLDQAVRKTHAVSTISRIVLGKRWKGLGDEQKKDFIETFTRLSIATYAHNFKAYSQEQFRGLSEQETARGGKLIRTVFVESNGNEVQFDYLMRKKGDRWLIVNIIADGVSDLAIKRSDYTKVVEQEGFEVLLKKLEKKIALYSQTDNQ